MKIEIFTPQDLELLRQLSAQPKEKPEELFNPKKFRKRKIKKSHFQLPGFVPSKDGRNWVPPTSRYAQPDNKLSPQQEKTKITTLNLKLTKHFTLEKCVYEITGGEPHDLQTRTIRRGGDGCFKTGL